jgi:hypothetical protein
VIVDDLDQCPNCHVTITCIHPYSLHYYIAARTYDLILSTVTGPVARFARQIASQGYIVAAPSSYHEFTGPEALAYDGPGTDKGNEWKITKKVEAYDEDAKLSVDALLDLPTCNGRIGATGTYFSYSSTIISMNHDHKGTNIRQACV